MSDSDVPRPDHYTPAWIESLNPDEEPTFLREFVRKLKYRCQSDPEYQRRYLAKRRRESWLYHTFGIEQIAWPPEWVQSRFTPRGTEYGRTIRPFRRRPPIRCPRASGGTGWGRRRHGGTHLGAIGIAVRESLLPRAPTGPGRSPGGIPEPVLDLPSLREGLGMAQPTQASGASDEATDEGEE